MLAEYKRNECDNALISMLTQMSRSVDNRCDIKLRKSKTDCIKSVTYPGLLFSDYQMVHENDINEVIHNVCPTVNGYYLVFRDEMTDFAIKSSSSHVVGRMEVKYVPRTVKDFGRQLLAGQMGKAVLEAQSSMSEEAFREFGIYGLVHEQFLNERADGRVKSVLLYKMLHGHASPMLICFVPIWFREEALHTVEELPSLSGGKRSATASVAGGKASKR